MSTNMENNIGKMAIPIDEVKKWIEIHSKGKFDYISTKVPFHATLIGPASSQASRYMYQEGTVPALLFKMDI